MGNRCTGHCCTNFSLSLSPDQLNSAYHTWLATNNGRIEQLSMEGTSSERIMADIHLIAPMVIYLGPDAKVPRLVEGNKLPNGKEYRYRCKHWDAKTKDCTIYEMRPRMCRIYPGGSGCNFSACTWSERKRVKRPKSRLKLYNGNLDTFPKEKRKKKSNLVKKRTPSRDKNIER